MFLLSFVLFSVPCWDGCLRVCLYPCSLIAGSSPAKRGSGFSAVVVSAKPGGGYVPGGWVVILSLGSMVT